MNSTNMDLALAAIILNDYCYNDISTSTETNIHNKVTFHGFSFLYKYLSKILRLDVTEWKIKDLYQAFEKKNLIPNVPLYFNGKRMKGIKTANLTAHIFDDVPEEEMDDFDKDLREITAEETDPKIEFPLALGSLSDTSGTQELMEHGEDYFSLNKLINLDIDEADLLFIHANNYPVLIDCDIKLPNYVLKSEDIIGAFLTSGLLEMVVTRDITKVHAQRFEASLTELMKNIWLDEVVIYHETTKMGKKLKLDYQEFVEEINK